MAAFVGIDLGTTSSRVALLEGRRPVIIENSEGEGTTPSYVAIPESGPRLVGEAALRYALTNPERVIFAVKRLIGRRYSDAAVKELARFMPFRIVEAKNGDAWVQVDGRDYSPAQIMAFILQKMKQTAEAYLAQDISGAVLAVPAHFDDQQRRSVLDAADIAGLTVLRILAEPTMAAVAYGLGHSEDQIIVVYDLGGGTFDVSILQLGDGVFEVKSTRSDLLLGGEDFDYKLIEHLAESFAAEHHIDLMNDSIARHRLKQSAERAKIGLSSSESVELDLPFVYFNGIRPLHINKTIRREVFEELIEPAVDRSIDICKLAMKDAGISVKEIDRIVLVGGSTRIPLVQRKLTEFFGKAPYGGLRREDAVALGTAIEAGILDGQVKDVLLLDVTPLSLGIETLGGVFTRLIERNTTIPTKKSQVFSTADDNQQAVTIKVYQGEREMAADNRLLGNFDLTGIPPAPRGVPQIEVTFDIDANGIVSVSAKDKATSKEHGIRVRAPGGLSADEITTMRADANNVGISQIATASPVDALGTPLKLRREEATEAPAVSSAPAKPAAPQRRSLAIYLGYTEQDAHWEEAIEKALGLLSWTGKVVVHASRKIEAGRSRTDYISKIVEESDIAILLISSDFLNDRSILALELPTLFAENERRGLALLPILVRPCAFELHADLSKFELFNSASTPLSRLEAWQVETELSRLTMHIATMEHKVAALGAGTENAPQQSTLNAGSQGMDHRAKGRDHLMPRRRPVGSIVIATANEREASAVYEALSESTNNFGITLETNTDPILPHTRGMMEGKDGPWEAYLVQADETGGAEAVDLLRRALTQFHPHYVFLLVAPLY